MVNHALLQLPYVSLGFGDLKSEFWLGLDKIQRPTSESNNMLRLDFEDFEENTALAEYNTFDVKSEEWQVQADSRFLFRYNDIFPFYRYEGGERKLKQRSFNSFTAKGFKDGKKDKLSLPKYNNLRQHRPDVDWIWHCSWWILSCLPDETIQV